MSAFELASAGPGALADHLNDTTDAHDASAISVVDTLGVFTGADVEAVLQELGVWASYTPELTAVTTNPTLGVASEQIGRWLRIGKLGIAQIKIKFGTSGTAAGSGQYRVGLPFTVGANQVVIGGVGMLYDASLFDSHMVVFAPVAGQAYGTLFMAQSVTAGGVTHAVPVPWTANDEIWVLAVAEIA